MDFLEIMGRPSVNMPKPWTQQYTPTELENIHGNKQVIQTISYYIQNNNIPNIIMTGPSGTGKQTTVKLLLKQYLGKYQKDASLIIHGSINRGKDVVSEKIEQKKNDKSYIGPNIMNFTKRKLNLPTNLCKIIVIYDFDQMTREAQNALRRIIELYSERVRFIFTCNNISAVIEALQSRCVILKFSKLLDHEIKTVLHNIIKKRDLNIDDEILNLICLAAFGDLKQAINYLQILAFSDEKDTDSFYKIFNIPPLHTIQQFIVACINNNSSTAYNIIQQLLNNGYNPSDILDILFKVVAFDQFKGLPKIGMAVQNGILEPELKIGFIKAINQCFYLVETSTSSIHLYYLISRLIMMVNQFSSGKKISVKSNII